jgi:ABC-type uncharacterized transport system substrate-binding protein
MPSVADIVVLADPKSPITDSALKDIQAAASTAGKPLLVLHAGNSQEINAAFPAMVQKRSPALVIIPSALFVSRRVAGVLGSAVQLDWVLHRRQCRWSLGPT